MLLVEAERQKHWLDFVSLTRTEAELKYSGSAPEVEHSLVR